MPLIKDMRNSKTVHFVLFSAAEWLFHLAQIKGEASTLLKTSCRRLILVDLIINNHHRQDGYWDVGVKPTNSSDWVPALLHLASGILMVNADPSFFGL